MTDPPQQHTSREIGRRLRLFIESTPEKTVEGVCNKMGILGFDEVHKTIRGHGPVNYQLLHMFSKYYDSFDMDWVLKGEGQAPVAIQESSIAKAYSNEVFIVHGHDENRRKEVAAVIKNLGLEPVILHERANEGKTVIEKFERHSDVGFAVIIMTADDFGRAKNKSEEAPRARQNVILEMGYFIGKLERRRVVALFEPGVEWPSDLLGFVYIELDAKGKWKLELVRELQAAGYAVSADSLEPKVG